MLEQSKSAKRRFNDGKFHSKFFVGKGIDIGAGKDSLAKFAHVFRLIERVDSWDIGNGDAQYLESIADNTYDFVHSSHCFEHMVDPYTTLDNWIRVTKPGGYLIITVPEETLYEHGEWPSKFNGDHKWSFSIGKSKHNMPNGISLLQMLKNYDSVNVLKIELIDDFFDVSDRSDQTRTITAECSIEVILQKV